MNLAGVSREQDAEATKRCFIVRQSAKTLDLIGLDADVWLDALKGFKSIGYSAVGIAEQLKEFSAKTKIKRTPALRQRIVRGL